MIKTTKKSQKIIDNKLTTLSPQFEFRRNTISTPSIKPDHDYKNINGFFTNVSNNNSNHKEDLNRKCPCANKGIVSYNYSPVNIFNDRRRFTQNVKPTYFSPKFSSYKILLSKSPSRFKLSFEDNLKNIILNNRCDSIVSLNYKKKSQPTNECSKLSCINLSREFEKFDKSKKEDKKEKINTNLNSQLLLKLSQKSLQKDLKKNLFKNNLLKKEKPNFNSNSTINLNMKINNSHEINRDLSNKKKEIFETPRKRSLNKRKKNYKSFKNDSQIVHSSETKILKLLEDKFGELNQNPKSKTMSRKKNQLVMHGSLDDKGPIYFDTKSKKPLLLKKNSVAETNLKSYKQKSAKTNEQNLSLSCKKNNADHRRMSIGFSTLVNDKKIHKETTSRKKILTTSDKEKPKEKDSKKLEKVKNYLRKKDFKVGYLNFLNNTEKTVQKGNVALLKLNPNDHYKKIKGTMPKNTSRSIESERNLTAKQEIIKNSFNHVKGTIKELLDKFRDEKNENEKLRNLLKNVLLDSKNTNISANQLKNT